MKAQEIFDKVAAHLRNAPGRCADSDRNLHLGICAYIGPNGQRCAVGALIPEDLAELVRLKANTKKVSALLDMPTIPVTKLEQLRGALLAEDLTENSALNLLCRLQIAHDRSTSWQLGRWGPSGEAHLACIARDWGLHYQSPADAEAVNQSKGKDQ